MTNMLLGIFQMKRVLRMKKSDSFQRLTDTGEDMKSVHRRKRSKVDTLFSSFFPKRSSDEYDSAPSRKYSRSLLNVFVCIG